MNNDRFKTTAIDWSKAVDVEIGELTPRMKEILEEVREIAKELNL